MGGWAFWIGLLALGLGGAEEFLLGPNLFDGKAALHGRMATHLTDLPTEVVRCSNCHATSKGAAVPRSTAPRLTPAFLLVPRSRRGGPPSRYNAESFCTVLRKGVDPARIMIDQQMPRYRLSDEECTALWRFVVEDRHE